MVEGTSPNKRQRIRASVRDEILMEAGYKCANPTCRNILTLDLHHIVRVKDSGGNGADNLIALCGHCHDLHTQGHIPLPAIRHWKGMLVALNHAFSTESMDLLVFLEKRGTTVHWYSADGVLKFAGLFAAGLVQFGPQFASHVFTESGGPFSKHQIQLSDKGRLLVQAWMTGNEEQYRDILERSNG